MRDDLSNSTNVKTLTKCNLSNGELYFRRPEVERQILKFLMLGIKETLNCLKISSRNDENYLLDETIVYFLREARDSRDEQTIQRLYLELNQRIWKLLFYRRTNFINKADFEDFGQKVEMIILEKIFDLTSDSADYAQVNFGDFVATQASVTSKANFSRINKEKQFFEIDKDNDDEAKFELESNELSTERKLILQQGIAKLPTNIRDVAILHYLDGWQIESKNPEEPTISKLYNVSSRTIRNWLKEARSILADYQGVGR